MCAVRVSKVPSTPITCGAHCMFASCAQRPLSEPLAEKREAVNDLLDKLALDVCRHVKIGNTMARGISGGQAKVCGKSLWHGHRCVVVAA